MSRLDIQHISKDYDGVKALDDVSIRIEDGEFMVILGPSGCGKTTLLRIIAGLTKPTEGKIYMDGEDITNLEPYDRNIAMVFQNYALYPHMTVYDNIAFPLKMKKVPKEEIAKKVREVAEALQLGYLLNRKPYELSGGQQQRVALARALVRNPKIFLFDEPLSNLDAKLRVAMREELKRFHMKYKITTIYVTHDQIEAMTLGDRIAIMNHGKIIQVGKPYEVYNNPSNTYVATFLGSPPMNLIKVRKCEKVNSLCIDKETMINVYVENAEIIGFRPSDITLNCSVCLSGRVIMKEILGDEEILHVQLGENEITIKVTGNTAFNVGDKIEFNVRKVYLFDKEGNLISVKPLMG